jgi:U3 small nucleolar RNA-associated protein 10
MGEEFLRLLPESIPFIAELMEDSSREVEQACQKLAKTLDEYLQQGGETLAEYMS